MLKYLLYSEFLNSFNETFMNHDGGPYRIETSPLICRANQWTSFYMTEIFVMKELKQSSLFRICLCSETTCNIISPLYFLLALFPSRIFKPVCYSATIFTYVVLKKLKKKWNYIRTLYKNTKARKTTVFVWFCRLYGKLISW